MQRREMRRIVVSAHGEARARERCGLNKQAVQRHVERVWLFGIQGWQPTEAQPTIRLIHGDYVWVFADEVDRVVLVTVLTGKARDAREDSLSARQIHEMRVEENRRRKEARWRTRVRGKALRRHREEYDAPWRSSMR